MSRVYSAERSRDDLLHALRLTKMTAELFAQSSEAANVDLWPVRSTNRALPGGARGAFTMVLSVRTEGRKMMKRDATA